MNGVYNHIMIDQSALKVFILLMEPDQDRWVVSTRRLLARAGERSPSPNTADTQLTYEEFLDYEESRKIDMVSVYKSLCVENPIFGFIFSDGFHRINHESIVIVRNNQSFLQQLYEAFSAIFLDPIDLTWRPGNFSKFADGFARFAYSLDLAPNLVSLKDLLLLVVYVKRYRELNAKEAKLETQEQARIFTFEEFKTLLVILNKYLQFKYTEIYNLHEETYFSNLLWYLLLKASNNDELDFDKRTRVYNDRAEENIFFQLNKIDLRADHELEVGIMTNLELLFLVFANNYAIVGNPQLTLDSKALFKSPFFKSHSEWIGSYLENKVGKGDFNDFLDVLSKAISVRKQGITKEAEFTKFVQDHSNSLQTQLATNYKQLPKLNENILRKVKRLFSRFAVDDSSLYVMDFLFLCKEYGVVPNQYTNKQIMTLFYQANIRELIERKSKRADVLNPKVFCYVNLNTFLKLLAEISENFLGGALQLDFDGKVELLFSKVIRV